MQYLLLIILLAFFGLFNLFGIKLSLFYNHLVFFAFGLTAFFVVRKIGLRFFRQNSHFFYWLFIILLLITHFLGFEAKGAKRWFDLFFFNLQPSEFLKVFYALFLADFFTTHRKQMHSFFTFVLSLIYFLIPFIFIYKQPDLGTALTFAFVYFLMLLFSNLPKKYWLYLSFFVILTLPVNWLFLKPYQKERIKSFVNHELDQRGTSYNMIQAVITVGSGKFLGRGLGLGTQSKLLFLPENHTDFAFSSLVEQFGFFGGFVVILLYVILVFLIARKLLLLFMNNRDEDNYFLFLFSLGILSFLIFQIFVNIGMNLGVIPVAGIGLPFISYGGSSLLTYMIALALLP